MATPKGKSLLKAKRTVKAKVKRVVKKPSSLSKKPKKVEMLVIDGEGYCPICEKRDCTFLDYGFKEPETYWFKALCKTCNVFFVYEKVIDENLEFVLKVVNND